MTEYETYSTICRGRFDALERKQDQILEAVHSISALGGPLVELDGRVAALETWRKEGGQKPADTPKADTPGLFSSVPRWLFWPMLIMVATLGAAAGLDGVTKALKVFLVLTGAGG